MLQLSLHPVDRFVTRSPKKNRKKERRYRRSFPGGQFMLYACLYYQWGVVILLVIHICFQSTTATKQHVHFIAVWCTLIICFPSASTANTVDQHQQFILMQMWSNPLKLLQTIRLRGKNQESLIGLSS